MYSYKYRLPSFTAPRWTALVLVVALLSPSAMPILAADQVIDTGDAVALLEVVGVVNQNEVEASVNATGTEITDTESSNIEGPTESATSTNTENTGEALYYEFLNPNTVEVNGTNTATTTTNATSTADTGNNEAAEGVATIVTGDAFAVANVVNLVNTNILNSNGFIQFFTAFGLETFDIRNLFSVFDTSNSLSTLPCAGSICGDTGTLYTSNNSNVANITNNIVVRANSGLNEGGEGDINTGDAYAVANVFNMANTNIVDSNYLVLSISNLGDMVGDLVLPQAELLKKLFSNLGPSIGSSQNTNIANIDNSTEVVAQTGENVVSGGVVNTGDANAEAAINNQVNQNLIGDNSLLILLRVHGNWSGGIEGLSDDLEWSESASGVTIYNNEAAAEDTVESAGGGVYESQNTNITNINNNIKVFALTGANKITGNGSIKTGDAYAAANVTNVANVNILSQNWALLIFDIFGDWDGNISFGRPDLWVGVKANSNDTPIMPGSRVDYTFTVSNLGDTRASNVNIENEFENNTLVFAEGDNEQSGAKTRVRIPLGDIAAGETKEFVYRATVGESLPTNAIVPIPLTATVSAKETEDVYDNNSDSIAIESGVITRSSGGSGGSKPTNIRLSKSADKSFASVPEAVNYEIIIENTGGPLYNAVLFDTLKNSAGDVMHEEFWNLGTILKNEIITVTYTTNFSSSSVSGLYTNTAEVVGTHRSKKATSNNVYTSMSASSTINIINNLSFPLVSGLIETCNPYLSKFSRFNSSNNDEGEVQKLQKFLNEHLGTNISTAGIFDSDTNEAVKRFQEKYRSEILDPWGMSSPSGYVYLTTRKTINEIYCKNQIAFPLTPTEEWILRQGRAQLLGLRAF